MKTTRVPSRPAQPVATSPRGERATDRAGKPGDPQEFARVLAGAERRIEAAAGVGPHGAGRGFAGGGRQQPGPSPSAPEGIEAWIATSATGTAVATAAAPAVVPPAAAPSPAGPSQAQLAELAESLVRAARVVVNGDRSTVDLELASGALGVQRVQIERAAGGAVKISLSVEHSEGQKLLEHRLDSLTSALDRRGLTNASIAIEAPPGRGETLAPRSEAEARPHGDGGTRHDGARHDGGEHGEGRSRGRQGQQRQQEETG